MGNRCNTKGSATEEPSTATQAQHVKEIAEGDYEAAPASDSPGVGAGPAPRAPLSPAASP